MGRYTTVAALRWKIPRKMQNALLEFLAWGPLTLCFFGPLGPCLLESLVLGAFCPLALWSLRPLALWPFDPLVCLMIL